MADLPEEIDTTDDRSLLVLCNRVCTLLKPSGDQQQDEEFIFEVLCQRVSERGRKNISFTSSASAAKIDNLKEHLFILVNALGKSDSIVECVYEFLDNVYPQDELWRLKIK